MVGITGIQGTVSMIPLLSIFIFFSTI